MYVWLAQSLVIIVEDLRMMHCIDHWPVSLSEEENLISLEAEEYSDDPSGMHSDIYKIYKYVISHTYQLKSVALHSEPFKYLIFLIEVLFLSSFLAFDRLHDDIKNFIVRRLYQKLITKNIQYSSV